MREMGGRGDACARLVSLRWRFRPTTTFPFFSAGGGQELYKDVLKRGDLVNPWEVVDVDDIVVGIFSICRSAGAAAARQRGRLVYDATAAAPSRRRP